MAQPAAQLVEQQHRQGGEQWRDQPVGLDQRGRRRAGRATASTPAGQPPRRSPPRRPATSTPSSASRSATLAAGAPAARGDRRSAGYSSDQHRAGLRHDRVLRASRTADTAHGPALAAASTWGNVDAEEFCGHGDTACSGCPESSIPYSQTSVALLLPPLDRHRGECRFRSGQHAHRAWRSNSAVSAASSMRSSSKNSSVVIGQPSAAASARNLAASSSSITRLSRRATADSLQPRHVWSTACNIDSPRRRARNVDPVPTAPAPAPATGSSFGAPLAHARLMGRHPKGTGPAPRCSGGSSAAQARTAGGAY